MGGIDEGLELGIGAEMRIDAGEVGHPVAVIARALLARLALHRLVLEDRREPDRGDAHVLDVVELGGQPLEIAAVVEALVRRIEAVIERAALQPAAIIARIAIFEAVGQDEIDDLVFELALCNRGRRRLLSRDRTARQGGSRA